MNFETYARSQNINLLRDDLSFIRRLITMLPYEIRREVLRKYCVEWVLAANKDKNEVSSDNSGRKRANQWLMAEVFKQLKKTR